MIPLRTGFQTMRNYSTHLLLHPHELLLHVCTWIFLSIKPPVIIPERKFWSELSTHSWKNKKTTSEASTHSSQSASTTTPNFKHNTGNQPTWLQIGKYRIQLNPKHRSPGSYTNNDVISCTTRTYLEDQLCSWWSEWSAPTNKLQSAAKRKGARADTYGLASRVDAYGAHNRWECLSQLPDITIPPHENQDTLFASMQTWLWRVFMLVTWHKHPSSWESRCPLFIHAESDYDIFI
jgi:hypothetical protein